MMDDIDRSCCATFEKALSENVPHNWELIERVFHDPGMDLIFQHQTSGFVGKPTVTVTVRYGRKKEGYK